MGRSADSAKDGGSEPSYFAQPPRPSSNTAGAAATTEAPTDSAATTFTVTPATPILEQPPTIAETTETPTAVPGSFPQPTPSPPTSPLVHARTVQDGRYSQFHPLGRQQSAIRVRRLRGPPAPPAAPPAAPPQPRDFASPANPPRAAGARFARLATDAHDTAVSGRRRSSSEPQHPTFPQAGAVAGPAAPLPPLLEPDPNAPPPADSDAIQADPRTGGLHRFFTRRRHNGPPQQLSAGAVDLNDQGCYDSRIVDFLDVIDPEVATLSSITNVQNSLFVPSFGRWVNRRPAYDLTDLPPIPGEFPPSAEDVGKEGSAGGAPSVLRSPSLSSVISGPQYAILPENATLEGWGEEDVKMLNDYVRHMLHSRRSKVKQRLKAFVKYASHPLGFLVTLYATLITLFGLAWVLFLIGWIYVGDKQLYAIDVIDYVLVALFNLVGLGLAPWRAVDTYHMAFVAHYHRKTWKLRKKLLLPNLKDHNDLPTETNSKEPDLEAGRETEQRDEYIPVLTDKEQKALIHHQEKLSKSHTFFKPHETQTHHAFPLRLLVTIVLLLDLHSCLQLALGICTYGVDKDSRSTAATTSILCCSITTNALAGILISLGDRRTRKKDVLERLLKQDLTAEMMDKIRKKKQKEEEEKAKGSDDGERGLLSLGAPLVDKIRKSTDIGKSGEIERKQQPEG